MRMRIVQVSCLLVLSFVARTPRVQAAVLNGPCPSHECGEVNPPSCWTDGSCQDFPGCRFFTLCGDADEHADCDCSGGVN